MNNRKSKAAIITGIILLFLFQSLLQAQIPVQTGILGHFQKASDFSFNKAGTFFVIDKEGSELLKLDSAGTVIKKIGGTGWDDYTFDDPADICVTMLKIFVADRNNNRVQVYDKDLNFLFSLDPKNFTTAKSVFKYPVSAQSSPFGDLYITDSDNKQILRFNSNWDFVNSFGSYEYGKYGAVNPAKLAIDNESVVYLLDEKRIIEYDQFGNGAAIVNLEEKPNNLSIMNDIIVLAYNKYIMYAQINNMQKGILEWSKIIFDLDKPISDAIICGGHAYILTEESIYIYSYAPLEQNN